MSESIAVFIPCLPPTATSQMKGVCVVNGKPRFFKKKAVQQAENSLWALLQPYAPRKPLDGPLCLTLRFYWPWRKSERKSRIKAFSVYPIETRPDIENVAKGLLDVMTTLRFWHDDSQISALNIGKAWADSERAGIDLCLARDTAIDRAGSICSPETPSGYQKARNT